MQVPEELVGLALTVGHQQLAIKELQEALAAAQAELAALREGNE